MEQSRFPKTDPGELGLDVDARLMGMDPRDKSPRSCPQLTPASKDEVSRESFIQPDSHT